MKKLYFIENIHTTSLSDNGRDVKYTITLEDVERSEDIAQQELWQEGFGNEYRDREDIPSAFVLLRDINEIPTLKDSRYALHEGQYVYQDTETGDFEAAYKDSIAKSRLNKNLRLRNKLIALQNNNEREEAGVEDIKAFLENAHVESYHVNVGHGNCTIILIHNQEDYKLWMFDCGAREKGRGHSYYPNILTCLTTIADKMNKVRSKLHVSKLFISHWHYDHISGFQSLVQDGFVDVRTQCYVNLYYSHSSQCANALLETLNRLNIRCYEPTANISNPVVTILHPECRIRKKTHPYDLTPYRIVTNANNASVVYAITIGGRTMVFPGDLETDGWDAMTSTATCQKRPLCNTNYYCVSHHGSLTGHVDIPCLEGRHYPKVGDCLNAGPLCRAILMGRDGAYPGIYNKGVVNYWGRILRYSEHDNKNNNCRAYVLEWGRGNEWYL